MDISKQSNLSSEFTIIKMNDDITNEPQLKCFKSELVSIDFMTRSELFYGFDTIKAITFSYDIGFIEKIISQFNYAEIILGADYLVQKDNKLNSLVIDVLANSDEASRLIKKHNNLVEMIKNENIEFRTPQFILDHRKIYLLSSDDGRRTRVITTSANMSKIAWNNEHMEFYNYDDTSQCYEEYEKDFETAWVNSCEIPYSVISAKKSDNIIEGNPILKKIKETQTAMVLKESNDEISFENKQYVINHERIEEEYKEVLSNIKMKSKNGFIEIVPEVVEKIEHNFKKIKKKYIVKNVTEDYPLMTIDYENHEVMLNDEILNLNPTAEEIKKDIDLFIEMFNNFDNFVGDSQKLKESHFKMINAIFASPFHAKLRCDAKIRDIEASSLPLYLLAASSTANCGKTFMISAALKMMTGKNVTPFNKTNLKKDDIIRMQIGCKGIPIFIDELDARSFSYIKDLIKNPERCEDNQIDTMPMIIFASNNILEPDEIFRKRMVFLRFDGRLPSDIDQSAYKNMGHALIRRFGTGLYREYLNRMVEQVSKELDYIVLEKEIPGEYYPDLMKKSSDIIISILNDYGYSIPSYIYHMTWNSDYSINASFISEDAILSIEKLYRQNKKAFILDKDTITIEMGTSTESKKKCESWVNTLPSEMRAEMMPFRDCIRITLDRKEFEKRLGYKLGGLFRFGKR